MDGESIASQHNPFLIVVDHRRPQPNLPFKVLKKKMRNLEKRVINYVDDDEDNGTTTTLRKSSFFSSNYLSRHISSFKNRNNCDSSFQQNAPTPTTTTTDETTEDDCCLLFNDFGQLTPKPISSTKTTSKMMNQPIDHQKTDDFPELESSSSLLIHVNDDDMTNIIDGLIESLLNVSSVGDSVNQPDCSKSLTLLRSSLPSSSSSSLLLSLSTSSSSLSSKFSQKKIQLKRNHQMPYCFIITIFSLIVSLIHNSLIRSLISKNFQKSFLIKNYVSFFMFLVVIVGASTSQATGSNWFNDNSTKNNMNRYSRSIVVDSIITGDNENSKLNRSLTLNDIKRMIRQPLSSAQQPLINHLNFCGEPPIISHAQSNLHRNQKHRVFPVGQEASYMCEQGYVAMSGTQTTRCTIDNSLSSSPSSSASHIIFPDYSQSHHQALKQQISSPFSSSAHLVLGSGRSKNSKRLMSNLDEEEQDLNSNSASGGVVGGEPKSSILFPNHFEYSDRRKMSRKNDDEYSDEEILGGRHADPNNFDNENLEKKQMTISSSYYDINKQAARWWPPITLDCQIANCSDPGPVEHAKRKDPASGTFSFNTNIHYECEEGYETYGIPILTCRANGTWNRPLPKCHLKQCPLLPKIENGRILYSDADRRTHSRAEYHCEPGFRLNNMMTVIVRHCGSDDQWSSLGPLVDQDGNTLVQGEPTNLIQNNSNPYQCVPVTCSAPVRPHNGLRIVDVNRKQRLSRTNYTPGNVIIYDCVSNGVKVSAKCRADGEWSRGAPHCPINEFSLLKCAPISIFTHGTIKIEQHKALFTCNDGYELEGPISINCNPNGMWGGPFPRCLLRIVTMSNSSVQSNDSGQSHMSNANLAQGDAIINDQQDETASYSGTLLLLVFLVIISFLILLVVGGVFFYRWRQRKMNSQTWQRYFGHYYHRQSKTNIVMSPYNGNHHLNGTNSGNNAIILSDSKLTTTASKHLLQRGRLSNPPYTRNLQSSFSSSDENGADGKSLKTGTISSDHARTVSTYADDTCPEDDDYDEENDELYSNTDNVGTNKSTTFPITKSPLNLSPVDSNNSFGSDFFSNKRTNANANSNPNESHIYSNVSHALKPIKLMKTPPSTAESRFGGNKLINGVPVTDL